MAVIKAINSRASIANAINYITKKEKTDEKLISGYNCRGITALDEMKATKKAWNKTGGRQYKHFIQSFSPSENISPDEAHKIAAELVESWNKFKGYEVCYATHKDKNHIHTHIIVNSVSFENGKKFCYSKKELQDFKDLSDKILLKYDKSICEKNTEITSFNINEYKTLEKALSGKYESWILNIALAVNLAKQTAKSVEEFINILLQKGIKTEWKDSRKYITFKDKDNNKVRDKRLKEIFKMQIDKEVLINEFQSNSEQFRRQFTGTNDIETEIRNRQTERVSAEIERRKSAESRKDYAGGNLEKREWGINSAGRESVANEQRLAENNIWTKRKNKSLDR
ncbi:MAG: relaxase/mobilization nuclease domain-containing protein [Clostridiales bacterium]|nr:relaxase/mobilization nuclease domain-containing protein [Clostridiales bacterium]